MIHTATDCCLTYANFMHDYIKGNFRIRLPKGKYSSQMHFIITLIQFFLRCFKDPIRVPRIENRVPRIRGNYHRVPRIRENWDPTIREIGSLQVHTGYPTFSLKKTFNYKHIYVYFYKKTTIKIK